jgi:hypothetical protein
MTFNDYWDKIFENSAVGFIRNGDGKVMPIRLADRKVAEHFWYKALEENKEAGKPDSA